MPELPEVETILQSMKPALMEHCLTAIEVNRPDLRKPFPIGLAEIPLNQDIIQLRRRAKYMILDFRHGWSLLIHLGMSGRLFVDPPGAAIPPRKHEHLVLHSDDGTRIALVDPRRFGMVTLFPSTEEGQQPELKSLGVEPLSADFTPDSLHTASARTRMPIKNFLLDQRRIAGLGNIYVCEALFQAGIHPARPTNSMTMTEARRLHPAIVDILRAAITAGGSTLRDYVHTDGQPGAFQLRHRVYGRAGEPCPVCRERSRRKKNPILIERMTQNGRSTFFCPHCQKNRHEKGVISQITKENA